MTNLFAGFILTYIFFSEFAVSVELGQVQIRMGPVAGLHALRNLQGLLKIQGSLQMTARCAYEKCTKIIKGLFKYFFLQWKVWFRQWKIFYSKGFPG